MDKLLVILDTTDEASRTQLNVCKAIKPPIQGAIDCNDAKNEHSVVCQELDAFPAVCNLETKKCTYGVVETMEEFRDILRSTSSA